MFPMLERRFTLELRDYEEDKGMSLERALSSKTTIPPRQKLLGCIVPQGGNVDRYLRMYSRRN